MAVMTYKVIEELVFWVEGLDHPVKGRIVFTEDATDACGGYFWEISHTYKPTADAAGPYRPSRRNARTLEEARDLLLGYAENFQTFSVHAEKY
ncbi:hypothetical protein [Pseudomonas sp. PGPR81]|uniref:hypothetical protein n=1 Tax=Pseudomonas sp. PGPR81 TaxID=2913477 RepID=UPI001EDB5D05|nr:hypothetical protein [Pseudomonas sp. PGPR81]